MYWDDLRYFLAVAREGTLSAAAKKLGVSHATVLRRVDQLETDLEAKLFRRLQSGYRLTETGCVLLPHAQEVERKAMAIGSVLSASDDIYAGKIRISQPENSVINLYPLYQKFIQAHPSVTLEVDATSTLRNLNQHEADLALRITDEAPPSLVGRKLGKFRYSAYASEQYLQRLGNERGVQCDWVVWHHAGSNDADRQEKWLYRNVRNPRIVMRTSSVADVLFAVRAGMGAGIITDMVARQYPELKVLDFPTITSDMTLWLLTHRDLRKVPRIQLLMRFIADNLRAEA